MRLLVEEKADRPSMLYYGDNLPILRNRDYFPSESIDLVYLDPPFNSNQDYNVLFAEQDGSRSAAQIQAFTDTWRWDAAARRTFDEILEAGGKAAEALAAFRSLVGESDMLAYLSMMAPRLVELRRVLRPSGSIFLHCDPNASHYLKLLMDSIFGPDNLRNEIVWRRSHPKGLAFTRFARNHDTILYYARDGGRVTWNPQYLPYSEQALETQYRMQDSDGRRFQLTSLLNPNPDRPNLTYEFKGVTRVWRWTKDRMLEADAKGRIVVPKDGEGVPRYKRYLDEQEGIPVSDFWDDIGVVAGDERLGYPTQKPEALLDRIIEAGSKRGDTVLDPFCGCGTAVSSAQKLGRRWIGIDVTHLAISLIRNRLGDAYADRVSYLVVGEPADVAGAEALARQDRYQFQWWALGKIRARPVAEERKKGADTGIDGKLFFREKEGGSVKLMVIQVKSGGLKLSEVRDFGRVIEREKAQIGVLLTLDEPTRDMKTEAASMGFYKPDWKLSADDKYDRYQLLTIRELFEGKQPQYPPFRNVTFRSAPPAEIKGPKARRTRLTDHGDRTTAPSSLAADKRPENDEA
jgi:site-specific DNA-methyltransferase (adenine-specific)